MQTKFVCHGLIYLHVNFHDNRSMRRVILIIKSCRWGKKEKEPKLTIVNRFDFYTLHRINTRLALITMKQLRKSKFETWGGEPEKNLDLKIRFDSGDDV